MLIRTAKVCLIMLIFMAAAGISTYLTVHLLIRGEDTVIVPALTGKEVVHTLELLTDLGLNTKVRGSEYSADIPKHHVIIQDPEPGSEIKKGRDVRIVISKGPRAVVLPNLLGMGLPQARLFLEKNDLRPGRISYTHNKKQSKEEVLSQYPVPGAVGIRGDSVDLLVSAGPPPQMMAMADLRGMDLNQAIAVIEKHHLTTGTIRSMQHGDFANDMVLDHTPAAGFPVAAGSTVDVTINHHGRRANRERLGEVMLFRHRTSPGFLNQHVRVRMNRASAAVELFNAFVKPGKEIWLIVPKDQPATLLLYLDDELNKMIHYD
ncbi:MAG: PASTA domain-containing protein [Desulfobacteraceae bacterium]|nr:MAG: PASTA domain-containing protein [Desulfobacteraceae bacterium]